MERSIILVVDDMPENLRVLGEALEAEGHDVRVATAGEQALKIAAKGGLDLILLDIMMPGIDGYEVCNRLKEDPLTRPIPVLFLTALQSNDDEERGLRLGAADYLTKPYNFALVKVRVANHIALYRAQRELQKHNDELEALVAERSRELADAHQTLISVDAARFRAFQWIYRRLWDPESGLFPQWSRARPVEPQPVNAIVQKAEDDLRQMIQSALLVVPRFRSPGELAWPVLPLRSLMESAFVREAGQEAAQRLDWPAKMAPLYVRAEPDLITQALAIFLRTTSSPKEFAQVRFESSQTDSVIFHFDGAAAEARSGKVPSIDIDWAQSLISVFGGTTERTDTGWQICLPVAPLAPAVPQKAKAAAAARRKKAKNTGPTGSSSDAPQF